MNRSMETPKRKDPLEGVNLEKILTTLVEYYGWDYMGERVRINCFTFEPSIKSSLHFLRRTPWARTQVEGLYLEYIDQAKPTT